jgi:AraC-like DNA-binding protein
MSETTKDAIALERTIYTVNVTDTAYAPLGKRVSVFCDAVANSGFRWLTTPNDPDQEFSGRYVSLNLEQGAIGLVNSTPASNVRTKFEVANSDPDCFCLAHMVSGETLIEQGGRDVFGRRGDVLVFDCSMPVKISQRATERFEVLTLLIPRNKFANVKDANRLFYNMSISAHQIMRPLSACLMSIREQLQTASPSELIALYEASGILLPAAVSGLGNKGEFSDEKRTRPNRYLRELLQFVNANIGNAELSPRSAAHHVGMSVRWVHRQFALSGTTFGTYIMAKRLEYVGRDLISEECGKMPTYIVAFRWGFADLSTFIRAFKQKFGCTPQQYRLKG